MLSFLCFSSSGVLPSLYLNIISKSFYLSALLLSSCQTPSPSLVFYFLFLYIEDYYMHAIVFYFYLLEKTHIYYSIYMYVYTHTISCYSTLYLFLFVIVTVKMVLLDLGKQFPKRNGGTSPPWRRMSLMGAVRPIPSCASASHRTKTSNNFHEKHSRGAPMRNWEHLRPKCLLPNFHAFPQGPERLVAIHHSQKYIHHRGVLVQCPQEPQDFGSSKYSPFNNMLLDWWPQNIHTMNWMPSRASSFMLCGPRKSKLLLMHMYIYLSTISCFSTHNIFMSGTMGLKLIFNNQYGTLSVLYMISFLSTIIIISYKGIEEMMSTQTEYWCQQVISKYVNIIHQGCFHGTFMQYITSQVELRVKLVVTCVDVKLKNAQKSYISFAHPIFLEIIFEFQKTVKDHKENDVIHAQLMFYLEMIITHIRYNCENNHPQDTIQHQQAKLLLTIPITVANQTFAYQFMILLQWESLKWNKGVQHANHSLWILNPLDFAALIQRGLRNQFVILFFINCFGGQIATNLMITNFLPAKFRVRNSMVKFILLKKKKKKKIGTTPGFLNVFFLIAKEPVWVILSFFSHTFNSLKPSGLIDFRLNYPLQVNPLFLLLGRWATPAATLPQDYLQICQGYCETPLPAAGILSPKFTAVGFGRFTALRKALSTASQHALHNRTYFSTWLFLKALVVVELQRISTELGTKFTKFRLKLCTNYDQHARGIISVYEQVKRKHLHASSMETALIWKRMCLDAGVKQILINNTMILSGLMGHNNPGDNRAVIINKKIEKGVRSQVLVAKVWLNMGMEQEEYETRGVKQSPNPSLQLFQSAQGALLFETKENYIFFMGLEPNI
ncbi:hypothetical protein VP01_8g6 [Puccinia sorghi]|uniref:Uncharacterized protein n=1 Tax=Puccinia sorghi TaxID=27349 RepID=A0A0L6U7U5_9BASI|nr:hypothetical protein VP01_8g6 [Puccinia sorghi]